MTHVLYAADALGIATITLNRPEAHNAFDDVLIAEMTAAIAKIRDDASIRILVLTGNGASFSAGADLDWMQRISTYSVDENLIDAKKLAQLMHNLHTLGKPTVARIQGSAFGGGVGLIACCDIAIATYEAQFALSEARLGLIPAVISPYVLAAIGPRQARRYFLTGERFNAETARDIGLVHQLCYADELDTQLAQITDALLACGPAAQTACKELIQSQTHGPELPMLIDTTAAKIAHIRGSTEGREGIAAFLQKRAPNWLRQKSSAP